MAIAQNRALVPTSNQPRLVWSPHPVTARNQRFYCAPFFKGETLALYMLRIGLFEACGPVAVYLNDWHVDRPKWAKAVLNPGDIVTVRRLMAGGDGGDDDKTMRTVMTIAVIIASAYTGGAVGAAYSSFAGSVAAGVVSVGGMMLVTSMYPPPAPALQQSQGMDQVSTTYSLRAGRNRMRRNEPLLILLGKHLMFPDADTKPFTSIVDNDQWLYQSFNFGLTKMQLSNHRVGDTPVTNYDEFDINADLEIADSTGQLFLFPQNVDTLSVGVALPSPPNLLQNPNFDNDLSWAFGSPWSWDNASKSGKYVYSAMPYDYSELSQTVSINNGEAYWVSIFVSFEGSYPNFNNPDLHLQLGGTLGFPFLSSGNFIQRLTAGSGNKLAIRTKNVLSTTRYVDNIALVAESALISTIKVSSVNAERLAVDLDIMVFRTAPEGVVQNRLDIEITYRKVGTSPWLPYNGQGFGVYSILNSSRSLLRKTIEWPVFTGQYEVRLRRLTVEAPSAEYVADATWVSLRTFQKEGGLPNQYVGQQRVAMRVRATGQLNGVIDQYNALATGLYPAWNGSAWVEQATSNPAWLYRWWALGQFDSNGKRLFGGGLAQVEEGQIIEWGNWCDANGLACNMVVDVKMAANDVLEAIAICGRATPSWGTGKLGVVWDNDAEPVTQGFGMGNIRAGTFEVSYVTGDLPDQITVEFINEDLNYQPDTVSSTVPGVVTPINPVTVPLWGITSLAQAIEEANLKAADQFYHRRRISWEADIEAAAVKKGSVVTLSHDLTQWGYSGRVLDWTPVTITLDRAVPRVSGQQEYITLRYPDNTMVTITLPSAPTGDASVLAGVALPGGLYDDHSPGDFLWWFDAQSTPGKKVKIIDVQKAEQNRIRLTATDEDPAYYAAKNNPYNYTAPNPFGDKYPTLSKVELSDTLIRAGGGYAVRVDVSWVVASGSYGGAFVRYRRALPFTDDGEAWTMLPATVGTSASFQFDATGHVEVDVLAYNKEGERGASSSIRAPTYSIVGKDATPGPPLNLTAVGVMGGIDLAWTNALDVDIDYTRILRSTVANMTGEVEIKRCAAGDNTYTDPVGSNETFFYRAQHVDNSHQANVSPFEPLVGGISATSLSVNYGADVDGVPTQLADINAVEGGKLTGIAENADVTSSKAFAAAVSWDFVSSFDGWLAAYNADLSLASSSLVVTPTGTSPRIIIDDLFIDGAINDKLFIRIKRTNTASAWGGIVFFSTANHGISWDYYKSFPEPTDIGNGYVIVEIDMSVLTVGGNDWISSEIIELSISVYNGDSTIVEFDWIAVGKRSVDPLALRGVSDNADETGANVAKDTVSVSGVGANIIRSSGAAQWRNGFEPGGEFEEWTANSAHSLTAEATQVFSGWQAAKITTTTKDTDASGFVGGVWVAIPEELALAFAGTRVEIIVYAKVPVTGGATSFEVAYSTSDVGNSGWQSFVASNAYKPYSFTYDVPSAVNGGPDYLGIQGDGNNGIVFVDSVLIKALADWNDLPGLLKPAPDADKTQVAIESGLDAVSSNVSLFGIDAFRNVGRYRSSLLHSLDHFSINATGDGYAEIVNGSLLLWVGTSSADVITATLKKGDSVSPAPSWNKERRAIFVIRPDQLWVEDISISFGSKGYFDFSNNWVVLGQVGFKVTGSELQAFTSNGASETVVSILALPNSSYPMYLEMHYLPGQSVAFYLGGGLVETITTTLPPVTQSFIGDLVVSVTKVTSAPRNSGSSLSLGEYKISQR